MAPKCLLNAWASGGLADINLINGDIQKWWIPQENRASKTMRFQPFADQIVQRMLLKIGVAQKWLATRPQKEATRGLSPGPLGSQIYGLTMRCPRKSLIYNKHHRSTYENQRMIP
jgi:hypothetical protein